MFMCSLCLSRARVTSVQPRCRVSAGGPGVPHTGAPGLLAGVKQLPDVTRLRVTIEESCSHLGTPTQSLVMPPLFLVHQSLLPSAWLHSTLHGGNICFSTSFLSLSLWACSIQPWWVKWRLFLSRQHHRGYLEISPMLGYFTLPVIEQSIKNPNLDIILLIEAWPLLQPQVVRATETIHIGHQTLLLKLSRHVGSAGVPAGEEAVAAPGPVILPAPGHVIHLAQQRQAEARTAGAAIIAPQLRLTADSASTDS